MKKITKNIISSLVVASLYGCGGGGGNPVVQTDPDPVPVDTVPTDGGVTTNSYIVDYTGDPQIGMVRADVFRSVTGADGSGVKVAVVDSGVRDTHVELAGKVDSLSSAGVNINVAYDANGNPQLGSVYLDSDYSDVNSVDPDAFAHGTHVAGIVAGESKGVAPGSSIMAIRVFQPIDFDGTTIKYGDEDMVATGIVHAINNGAKVINLSLSQWAMYDVGVFVFTDEGASGAVGANGVTSFQYVRDAVANNDVALIAAAGNNLSFTGLNEAREANHEGSAVSNLVIGDGVTRRSLMFDPATEKKVLYVVSADEDGHVWGKPDSYSNTPGRCSILNSIEASLIGCDAALEEHIQNHFITAPGTNIVSADGHSDVDYVSGTGTSMAAPVVTGAYALIKSNWNYLSAETIIQIMKDTAKRDFAEYDPSIYGVGILDLQAAMSPLGTLSVYGSPLSETMLSVPASVRDTVADKLKTVAAVDMYNRDFKVDMSSRVLSANGQMVDASRVSASAKTNRFGTFRLNEVSSAMMLTSATGMGTMVVNSGSFYAGFGDQMVDPIMMTGGVPAAMMSLSEGMKLSTAATFGYLGDKGLTMLNAGSVDSLSGDATVLSMSHGFYMDEEKSGMLLLGVERSDSASAFGFDGTGAASGMRDSSPTVFSVGGMKAVGNGSAWIKIRYGEVGDTGDAMLSFKDVRIGQMVIGFSGESRNGLERFGIQAYSDLKPVSGTMSWSIPVGMNENGVMQYLSGRKNIGSSILPDSVMIYYSRDF